MYYPEHFKLVLGVEAVAAFDFYGGAAFGHHFVYAGERLGVKIVFGSAVEEVGGVEYSASAGCYLFVAEAVDFVEEFAFAAAGIYDMGVAVAERRHQQAAFSIDNSICCGNARIQRTFGHRAEAEDGAVVGNAEPGVGEDSQF